MRAQGENLLSILNSAVHGKSLSLQEPVDYEALFKLAREQNVQAIVGEVLCQDPEFMKVPLYPQAIKETMELVMGQSSRTSVFLELYRALDAAGVRPLVMKGIVCRELYGELRDHRPSGDEDILIRPEEFRTVQQVMADCGYEMEWQEASDRQLEQIQEVTFENFDSGLHVEVHTNPIGHESGIRRKMNGLFASAFEGPRKLEIDGTVLWTMNHTDHFLFLVLHAFKHMLTSSFGIRQVLDILLYEEAYGDSIRWDYVEKSLKQVHAWLFFSDLIQIGNQYLGFDLPRAAGPVCPEDLMEDLLSNGIFGSTEQRFRTAASITSAALDAGSGRNRLVTILHSGFPSLEFMVGRNPELADKPWLLPLCWIKRWGRYIRYNRKNGGHLAAQSIAVSQQRIRLLKKYRIL